MILSKLLQRSRGNPLFLNKSYIPRYFNSYEEEFWGNISSKLPLIMKEEEVQIDVLKEEDLGDVRELLLHSFSSREPVIMSLNPYYQGMSNFFENSIKQSIAEGLGTVMKSLKDNKLTKVQIAYCAEHEIENGVQISDFEDMGIGEPNAGILWKVFDVSIEVLRKHCKHTGIHPGKVVDLALGGASIPPSLRGKKIPQLYQLVQVSLALGKEKYGMTHAASILTNSFSQKEILGMGMEAIQFFDYTDFTYSGPGSQLPIKPFANINEVLTILRKQDTRGKKDYTNVAQGFTVGFGDIETMLKVI